MLQLWNGFAVEPVAGDVSPWERVLAAVVPDPEARRYVLRWLAWKIQNPGGVPGTILLVTGGKGTGKNSLFDPVVRIFGAHGRVFDDAEQIAGRFTGRLQTVAFAVLDEALFVGDPKQADRVKSRVTASSMTYEAKGRDPVSGVNRCAYVSLTNHKHVWQATIDERRAVVVETGGELVGDGTFWRSYYAWLDGPGPSALLHYLQGVDLSKFDRTAIPKGEALRRQIEHTTRFASPPPLGGTRFYPRGSSSPAVVCELRSSSGEQTEVDKSHLRESFEGSGSRRPGDWDHAMRKIRMWSGRAGIRERKERSGAGRARMLVLPPLDELREAFASATGVKFEEPEEPPSV